MPPGNRTFMTSVASAVQGGGTGVPAVRARARPRLKVILAGSLAARAIHLKLLRDGRKKAAKDAKRMAGTLFSRVLVSRRQAYGEHFVEEDYETYLGASKRKRAVDIEEAGPPLAKRCLHDVRDLREEHSEFVSPEMNVPQMSHVTTPVGEIKFLTNSLCLCPCPGRTTFRKYLQQGKHKPIETATQRAQRLQASRLARSRKRTKSHVVKACREREALVHVPHARRHAHGESYDDYEPGDFGLASKRKRVYFGIHKMDCSNYDAPPFMKRRTVHPLEELGFIVQLQPVVVATLPDPPVVARCDVHLADNGVAHDINVPYTVPALVTSLSDAHRQHEVLYPTIPVPISIPAAFDSISVPENHSVSISFNDNTQIFLSTNSRSCDFIDNVSMVPAAQIVPPTTDYDPDSLISGIRCASINAYAGPVTHSLFQPDVDCELDLSTISSTLSFTDSGPPYIQTIEQTIEQTVEQTIEQTIARTIAQTITPPPTPILVDSPVIISATGDYSDPVDADMTLVDDAAADIIDKLCGLSLQHKMVCDTEEHSFIYKPALDCIPMDITMEASMEDVDAFLDDILSDFQLHDALALLRPTPMRDVSPETERRIAEAFGELDDDHVIDDLVDDSSMQIEENDKKAKKAENEENEEKAENEENEEKTEKYENPKKVENDENDEDDVMTLVTVEEDGYMEVEEETDVRREDDAEMWEDDREVKEDDENMWEDDGGMEQDGNEDTMDVSNSGRMEEIVDQYVSPGGGGGGCQNGRKGHCAEKLAKEEEMWKELFGENDGDEEEEKDDEGKLEAATNNDVTVPSSPAGSLFSETSENDDDIDCLDLGALALLPLVGQHGIALELRDAVDDSSLPAALFGLFDDLVPSTSNAHNEVSSLTRGQADGQAGITHDSTSDLQISQLSAMFANLM